jgi:hypothetical protein
MYRFTSDQIDFEDFRARFRKFNDAELLAFGKSARYMCSPAATLQFLFNYRQQVFNARRYLSFHIPMVQFGFAEGGYRMSWPEFVSSLIGAVAGSSLVGVFLQAYLSNRFAEKLERFKTSLSAELFEHQTRFAWLHTERSKALVRLYRLLAVADKAFTDMLRPIQKGGVQKENIENAGKAANAFFDFYDRNRLFFDAGLVQKLRIIEQEYRKAWATFVPPSEQNCYL